MIGLQETINLEETIKILTDKPDDGYESADEEIPLNVGEFLEQAVQGSGLESFQSIIEDPSNAVLEELQDQFGASFDINADLNDGKKRRGKKVMPKTLPSHLTDLFGNANMAYTLGNYAEAVHLLKCIIKEFPSAPQPWLQLAMIHDELGDPTKALQVYLVAAHLTKKDADLWKRLGDMFKAFENPDQAIYCYTKTIRINPQDTDSLWERALLYREEGLLGKAISGLKEILNILPNDTLTVKELADIYIQIGNNQAALEIFELMMNSLFQEELQTIDQTLDGCEIVGHYSMGVLAETNTYNVGFEEVHTLANLYISISEYDKAANTIIIWVEKLKRMQFSDPLSIDYDFDSESDIPIELRVKLGICRLYQGSVDTAKLHFQRLMIFLPSDHINLFREVADAFIFHSMYHDALSFLEIANQGHQLEPHETFLRMAKCYYNLGDSETAIQMCESALDSKPADVDSKMMLAVLYEDIGSVEKARQLTDEVEEMTRIRKAEEKKKALDLKIKPKTPTKKIDRLQLLQEEKQKVLEARELYDKINSLLPLSENNISVRKDCLRYMRQLVSRFTSTNDFYPAERSKEFSGLSSLRFLKNLSDPSVDEILQDDCFQGICFEDWYKIFIKHAQLLTRDGNQEEAHEVLKSAFDASIFFHVEEKRTAIKLHMIASAIFANNFPMVSELCRYFLNDRLLTNDMYHLYIACLSKGYGALEYFASQHNQRYFVRNIKVLEKEAKKSRNALEFKNPVLYTLHGHISTCSRSYLDALYYYMRAYKLAPKDPLINLCMGISHLHRAMQRKASDRHEHITCAFMFFLQYQELCESKLESYYNLGRAFHHIGLYHLAIDYYEKGLAIGSTKEKNNLCHEIAYNLSLIYCQSENTTPLMKYTKSIYFVSGLSIGFGTNFIISTFYKREIEHDALIHGSPGPITDILQHKSYIGAYNRVSRNPYWVAEHLSLESLNGQVNRKHLKFRENSVIPEKFRSHLSDYAKSGYDRGHLVPAADITTNSRDLAETFLLSNCSPQNIGFNRGYWASLEKKIRSLTNSYSDVYVLTGPLFIPHKEADGYYVKYKVIGDPPNTAVPTHFFKVVLATNNDSNNYIGSWVLPNSEIPSGTPLEHFETKIESVEMSSGLEFFPKVDKSLAKSLINVR